MRGTHSPEEIWLGVELEVDALEVDVEFGNPRVGHADNDGQEVRVLAEVERRCKHRRGPTQILEKSSLAHPSGASGSRRKCSNVGEEVPPHCYLHGDEKLLV